MAKKVVAKIKRDQAKVFAKIIKVVRSSKTKAYTFKEEIVPADEVQKAFDKTKSAEGEG